MNINVKSMFTSGIGAGIMIIESAWGLLEVLLA